MMFCVVVPMVFCSIASAIANMKSVKRAGKIMGVTIATFLVTAAIAGILMYIVCRIFPLVDGHYTITEGEIGDTLGFGDMIVNFFTKPDFMELLSRKAILPLIVAAVLRLRHPDGRRCRNQDREAPRGCYELHHEDCELITYYAPIGFFGFFADLVATYGPELVADYSRTLIIYYVMSFVPTCSSSSRSTLSSAAVRAAQDHVLQAVPPGSDFLWYVLFCCDHPDEHGSRGGDRY